MKPDKPKKPSLVEQVHCSKIEEACELRTQLERTTDERDTLRQALARLLDVVWDEEKDDATIAAVAEARTLLAGTGSAAAPPHLTLAVVQRKWQAAEAERQDLATLLDVPADHVAMVDALTARLYERDEAQRIAHAALDERDALRLQAQAGEALGVELLKVEGREQALQAALDRLIDAAATYADIVDRGERPPEAVVDELGRALIDAPEVSLDCVKAQWLNELLDNVKSRDLHTNNGDIRHDAAQRAGWNACLDELRRQAEGLCEDEGCPQHGTDHVCINRQAKEPPHE